MYCHLLREILDEKACKLLETPKAFLATTQSAKTNVNAARAEKTRRMAQVQKTYVPLQWAISIQATFRWKVQRL